MQNCLVVPEGQKSMPVATRCCLGRAIDDARLHVQSPQQLEVPPQGASAELEGLTGVWAAVKCLVAVGSSNVDLIKSHARYIPYSMVCKVKDDCPSCPGARSFSIPARLAS